MLWNWKTSGQVTRCSRKQQNWVTNLCYLTVGINIISTANEETNRNWSVRDVCMCGVGKRVCGCGCSCGGVCVKWGGRSQSSNRHSDCVRKCNRKLLFCEMLFLSGGGWTPEPIKCCHSCHKTCNILHRAGSNGSLAILDISPCNHRFSKAGSSAAQGCNLFKPTVVSLTT